MRLCVVAALAAAFALAAPIAAAQDEETAPQAPTTAREWRETARADLDALQAMLRDHTPIAVDAENPRMQRWFERGYREARARAGRVRDRTGYFYALAGYINGFQDPHVAIQLVEPLTVARWPGFITTARGEDAVVLFRDETDAAAPAPGARVVSCDGVPLARLQAQKIYPFTLNPQIALDRRASLSRIFLDRGNPFAQAPRRCVFEEDGRRRTLRLNWREASQSYWTDYTAATAGPRAAFGLDWPAEDVAWIGLPTFGNEESEALQALIDEVAANAERIRNARAVVIDVRGNGGGNSAWGQLLARALWGEEAVEAIPDPGPGGATDWRASEGNLDYLNEIAPELFAQFGEESEVADWIRDVQSGMAGAIARGEALWRQRDAEDEGPIRQGGGYAGRRPEGASPIPARVYMLSNGACASACLDFADTVLHIPGVQLIGENTSGDGLLMEIRGHRLPSGLAAVGLPMKVYRGRPRGSLEAYEADVRYDGVWTDEAVRAWAMELVSAQ